MIFFFGTYLSKQRGHFGPSQVVGTKLEQEGMEVRFVSDKSSAAARFVDSLRHALFSKMQMAVLDIYSSRVIFLSQALTQILKRRKIPYVATLHGGAIPERWPTIEGAISSILSHAHKVTTPSKYIQQFVLEKGFDCIYIPNPIAINRFPFKPKESIEEPVKLLWVRGFTEIYRPKLAIDVLQVLQQMKISAELSMVGPDLGLLEETKKYARQMQLSNQVSFVGSIPNDKLYPYFHKADVLLNTTRFESFGLAVSEAASCGLPCVSTKVGELPYVWTHEENILFAEHADGEHFAKEIVKLLEDEQLHKKLSQQAAKQTQAFSLEPIMLKWKEILTKSCSPIP